jgi:hypothetical protein
MTFLQKLLISRKYELYRIDKDIARLTAKILRVDDLERAKALGFNLERDILPNESGAKLEGKRTEIGDDTIRDVRIS